MKVRKHAFNQESDKEKEKRRKKTRSRPRKKEKKLSFFLDRFFGRFLGRGRVFLSFFLLTCFLLLIPTSGLTYHSISYSINNQSVMRVNINKTNNRFFNLVLNPNTKVCEYFLSSLPQLEVWERKYLFRFYTCTSLFFLFNSGPKTKEACCRCERQTYEYVMENVRACRSEGRGRWQICYTTSKN